MLPQNTNVHETVASGNEPAAVRSYKVFEVCAWRPRTLLCLQQRFRPLDLAIILRNAFLERQLTRPERAVREPGTSRLYAPPRMICYTFEVGRLGVRWQAMGEVIQYQNSLLRSAL